MSNDPVRLADNVMAFLLDRQGDAPDKSLLQSKIEADYDGKVFPFTLRFGHVAWSETTGQDYGVVVSLDERPVLHVDLYSVDLESPLAKQAFHVVRTFEDGEWTGVLMGVLHRDREQVGGWVTAAPHRSRHPTSFGREEVERKARRGQQPWRGKWMQNPQTLSIWTWT